MSAAKCLPSSTWKVLNDEINSDHSPILIEVGQAVTNGVTQRKNWKNMVWDNYKEKSEQVITNLLLKWDEQEVN